MSNIHRNTSGKRRTTVVAVAAAVAAGLMPAVAPAATIRDITAISTRTDTGVSLSVSGVAGIGLAGSAYKASSVYTMTYDDTVQKLLSVTAGGTTYSASGMANNVVRRFDGPNNDTLWYATKSAPSASGSTITVAGPALGGFTQAFDSNNLLVGADNLFVNTGNTVGNNANVDRLDMLFASGITASSLSAFAVTDRGASNDHDAFKIAAVTAVDANGNPSNYGPLLSYADGTWGKTNLVPAGGEVVVRRPNTAATASAAGTGTTVNTNPALYHPSDYVDQPIGGMVVRTSDLVAAGTTIYGYSLFAPTVTGTGTQLVNWTNGKYFPEADYTSKGGGLDPTATLAVLFTAPSTALPEPATVGVAAVAAVGLLARRRRA